MRDVDRSGDPIPLWRARRSFAVRGRPEGPSLTPAGEGPKAARPAPPSPPLVPSTGRDGPAGPGARPCRFSFAARQVTGSLARRRASRFRPPWAVRAFAKGRRACGLESRTLEHPQPGGRQHGFTRCRRFPVAPDSARGQFPRARSSRASGGKCRRGVRPRMNPCTERRSDVARGTPAGPRSCERRGRIEDGIGERVVHRAAKVARPGPTPRSRRERSRLLERPTRDQFRAECAASMSLCREVANSTRYHHVRGVIDAL